MISEITEPIDVVLNEMFEIVGEKYTKDKVKEPEWFRKHTWSIEQQLKFKNWLDSYLLNNKSAREGIMAYPIRNKKKIGLTSDFFIFNYGWRLEDGN